MKIIWQYIVFFTFPFLIAAAFKFTDWMGWPSLAVLGLFWFGTILVIAEQEKKQVGK